MSCCLVGLNLLIFLLARTGLLVDLRRRFRRPDRHRAAARLRARRALRPLHHHAGRRRPAADAVAAVPVRPAPAVDRVLDRVQPGSARRVRVPAGRRPGVLRLRPPARRAGDRHPQRRPRPDAGHGDRQLCLGAGAVRGRLRRACSGSRRRLFRHREPQSGRFLPRLAVFRAGHWSAPRRWLAAASTNKAIDVVDAFADSRSGGGLPQPERPVRHGPFTEEQQRRQRRILPWPEAVARTRSAVLSPGEQPLAGDDYPLLRARSAASPRSPVRTWSCSMLESWDAAHVDATRRAMGLPGLMA
ncbi:MAG: hypothetical protein MZV65_19380 [Chromatiales bacterium]|nr:hypothetical protein [Chromatiales bacterium]